MGKAFPMNYRVSPQPNPPSQDNEKLNFLSITFPQNCSKNTWKADPRSSTFLKLYWTPSPHIPRRGIAPNDMKHCFLLKPTDGTQSVPENSFFGKISPCREKIVSAFHKKCFVTLGTFKFQHSFQSIPFFELDELPSWFASFSISKKYALRTEKMPFFVPHQIKRSSAGKGLRGILLITFASSSKKISAIRSSFHLFVSWSISSETQALLSRILPGDCTL
jgi:hypothetical protein